MNNSHLKFRLKKEQFSIPVSMVLKILEYHELTGVPQSPSFLKGVLNWQGSILPVVDLNLKLGFTPTEVANETCILVLEVELEKERTVIGCLVDQVISVDEIQPDEIASSPSIGSKYESELIRGMYSENNTFTIILDFVRIFDNEDIVRLSQNELDKDSFHNIDSKES